MGANTYIGNAPNFMVKAIAESRGVRMPSFFAYLGWALPGAGAGLPAADVDVLPMTGRVAMAEEQQ